MKQTITRTLQQNYHIDYNDRYLMATLIEVGTFDADEDPAISYATLKERLDKGYFAAYPHMMSKQVESKPEPVRQIPSGGDAIPMPSKLTKAEKEERANQAIITEINNCTSENMLSAYKLISANKPLLKVAYDKKLSSLQKETV